MERLVPILTTKLTFRKEIALSMIGTKLIISLSSNHFQQLVFIYLPIVNLTGLKYIVLTSNAQPLCFKLQF